VKHRNWLEIVVKLVVLASIISIFPFSGFTVIYLLNKDFGSGITPAVALVLGAGVKCEQSPYAEKQAVDPEQQSFIDCWPTRVLQKRLDKALDLYGAGKVAKILVSGDNRSYHYNEPAGMFRYLHEHGVKTEDIVQDFAGRRTVDSCWRARNVFQATRVYVVTQAFHMGRSLYLCQAFGLQTVPAVADDPQPFDSFWVAREALASWVAFRESYEYEAPVQSDGSEPNLGEL
jgi:vancomycin permeability regulator SanA